MTGIESRRHLIRQIPRENGSIHQSTVANLNQYPSRAGISFEVRDYPVWFLVKVLSDKQKVNKLPY